MRIRIWIQQLKLMRIHADPDTDPKPCLLRPGARHHRIVRVDAEVGAVLRETDRRVVEDVRGLRTRQDARRGARLKVDAVLFRAGRSRKSYYKMQISNFFYIFHHKFGPSLRNFSAENFILDSVLDPEQHPDPDPHHFGNLDQHPDPHPHQIKIRIRIRIPIKVISWIRNRIRMRINLSISSQNVWYMSLF
jgi:hypothetical protein